MKWNWDFLRGKKTLLEPPQPSAGKQIHINGAAHEIQGASLSDMEVAGRVRMLMRTDLNHESVCTLARDRIVYLSDRLDEATSVTEEQIGRAIYAVVVEVLKHNFEPMGISQRPWEELDPKDRDLHLRYGAAVKALLTCEAPAAPPPPDSRIWIDRTALSSKFEEQQTRDGQRRHRLKGAVEWTEGRPPREGPIIS